MPLGLPNPLDHPTRMQRAKHWWDRHLPVFVLFAVAMACGAGAGGAAFKAIGGFVVP